MTTAERAFRDPLDDRTRRRVAHVALHNPAHRPAALQAVRDLEKLLRLSTPAQRAELSRFIVGTRDTLGLNAPAWAYRMFMVIAEQYAALPAGDRYHRAVGVLRDRLHLTVTRHARVR